MKVFDVRENPPKVVYGVALSGDEGGGGGDRGLLEVIQAALSCHHREFQSIRSADLGKHAGEVVLNRLFAHVALRGNLLVRPASHYQCENIPLSPRQPERQFSPGPSRGLYEGPDALDQVGDERAPQPVLTRHDATNGFEQQFRARILHDEASNAELNCRQKFRFIECSRQEDRPHAVPVRFEFAHRFKPRFWGHADIEEQKVRIGRFDHSHGLFAGRRFADNTKTGADVYSVHLFDDGHWDGKQLAQAGSENTVVVCQDNTDGGSAV